jgi:hypothetical protein
MGFSVVIGYSCELKSTRSVAWVLRQLDSPPPPGGVAPGTGETSVLNRAAASTLPGEGDWGARALAALGAQRVQGAQAAAGTGSVAAGPTGERPGAGSVSTLPAALVRECRTCPAAVAGRPLGCAAHVAWPLAGLLEHALWVTGGRALQGELPQVYGEAARQFALAALRRKTTPWVDHARRWGLLSEGRPRGEARLFWQRQRQPHSGQLLEHYLDANRLTGAALWQHAGFTRALVAVGERLADALRHREQADALRSALAPWHRVGEVLWLAADQGQEVFLQRRSTGHEGQLPR